MQSPTTNLSKSAGSGGRLEHRHYLIDRFPVSFQGGAAWSCQCREFTMSDSCRHTREAAGMREAQARIVDRAGRRTASLVNEIRAR